MSTANHSAPPLTFTARRPWSHRRLSLAPDSSTVNILYTHRDQDGGWWWSDGVALFRGEAPAYLRTAYLNAGLPVDVGLDQLPVTPVAARFLIGARLAEPVASYEVIAGSRRTIPVAVFATGDRACPELHVDARYLAHARDRFAGCTFWRMDDATAVGVRDRRGRELVGTILCRRPLPEHLGDRKEGAA